MLQAQVVLAVGLHPENLIKPNNLTHRFPLTGEVMLYLNHKELYMSYSTRFKVTGTPVTITTTSVPEVWESFSTLQGEIDAAPSNSTLDLTGRLFGAVPGDASIRDNNKPLTITGGAISAALPQAWSNPVSGSITADLTEETVISGSAPLIDRESTMIPRLATWPEPPAAMLPYPTDTNENWITVTGSATNGIIHTDEGDNANGATITGFEITDPTTLAYINSGIGGLTASSLCVFHHSSSNRVAAAQMVSWNPTTGVAVLNAAETLEYNGYFSMAFTGNAAFMRYPGDYVIDQSLNQAIYRPNGSSGEKAMVSLTMDQIWRSDWPADLTFNGVEFFGNTNTIWSRAVGESIRGSVVFNDCYFHEAGVAISGDADCYDCRFIQLVERGITGPDGLTIERCYFKDVLHSSAISALCDSGDDDPVLTTTVRDCYFTMPSSDHGQALSLYKNSWQNATIEHNLFVNCQRNIAFQPQGPLRSTPGVCKFENNLMIYDSQLKGPTAGQVSWAFNGLADDNLTSAQQVIIRSNTMLMSPSVYALDNDDGRWALTVMKLNNSTVNVENNFLGAIQDSAEDQTNFPARVPHKHANNLLLRPPFVNGGTSLYGASFAETDLPSSSTVYTDYVSDYENLTLATGLTTAATDGGTVGVRWTSTPTVSEALDAPYDWYTQWSAASVPVAASGDLSHAWFNQDLRV